MAESSTDPSSEYLLGKLGMILKKELPPNVGFALFLFEFRNDSPLLYISTAKREAVVAALKKFISDQPIGEKAHESIKQIPN